MTAVHSFLQWLHVWYIKLWPVFIINGFFKVIRKDYVLWIRLMPKYK